jgi:hypothetical protein
MRNRRFALPKPVSEHFVSLPSGVSELGGEMRGLLLGA